MQASPDCRQYFPQANSGWSKLLEWPIIIGIVVALGSIVSAACEISRRYKPRLEEYESLEAEEPAEIA